MAKNPKHRRIVYRVEVDLQTYSLLSAMSAESKRPIPELIAMAARLFRATTANIHAMHPPSQSKAPLTPAQRAQHIARTRDANTRPKSIGDVLRAIAKKERKSR